MLTAEKSARTRYEFIGGASFNPLIDIEEGTDPMSSELGVFAIRELDERLRLTEKLACELHDPRDKELIRHTIDRVFIVA